MVGPSKSRPPMSHRKSDLGIPCRSKCAKVVLAAIPAGESPANRRSPVTVEVISSDGEGDRSVESLEVKVPEGWGVPVRSVQGGEQPGRPQRKRTSEATK